MMGAGDDVIATGMARGAKERGKKIAFGDGKRIIWGPHSRMIFKNNPNVAQPGQERSDSLEWVHYHKGKRIYNTASTNRWIWNYDFRVKPGEFFLDKCEEVGGKIIETGLVIIEPNIPNKPCAPNKRWPVDRFKEVADYLASLGLIVRQFEYGSPNRVAPSIRTYDFRSAVAYLKKAKLAILPEGGLHHAAAALGVPAVVLFGGFAPPEVLGYDSHVNLTGNSDRSCGSFHRCEHCVEAMMSISVDEVIDHAEKILSS